VLDFIGRIGDWYLSQRHGVNEGQLTGVLEYNIETRRVRRIVFATEARRVRRTIDRCIRIYHKGTVCKGDHVLRMFMSNSIYTENLYIINNLCVPLWYYKNISSSK
jgi:hypothetical protein